MFNDQRMYSSHIWQTWSRRFFAYVLLGLLAHARLLIHWWIGSSSTLQIPLPLATLDGIPAHQSEPLFGPLHHLVLLQFATYWWCSRESPATLLKSLYNSIIEWTNFETRSERHSGPKRLWRYPNLVDLDCRFQISILHPSDTRNVSGKAMSISLFCRCLDQISSSTLTEQRQHQRTYICYSCF